MRVPVDEVVVIAVSVETVSVVTCVGSVLISLLEMPAVNSKGTQPKPSR